MPDCAPGRELNTRPCRFASKLCLVGHLPGGGKGTPRIRSHSGRRTATSGSGWQPQTTDKVPGAVLRAEPRGRKSDSGIHITQTASPPSLRAVGSPGAPVHVRQGCQSGRAGWAPPTGSGLPGAHRVFTQGSRRGARLSPLREYNAWAAGSRAPPWGASVTEGKLSPEVLTPALLGHRGWLLKAARPLDSPISRAQGGATHGAGGVPWHSADVGTRPIRDWARTLRTRATSPRSLTPPSALSCRPGNVNSGWRFGEGERQGIRRRK